MRIRPIVAGDYQVAVTFLVNTPAAVAQAVLYRLELWQGEWFLDVTDGTPYLQNILGRRQNPDVYVKQRILSTPGVTAIVSFSTTFIGSTRALTVSAEILTAYSLTPVSISTSLSS